MTMPPILIVEDNAMIGLMIQMDLEGAGYPVIGTAPDNAGALDLVRKSRPALALVDIDLKGGDSGIDLVAILKDDYSVPSLFVTGQAKEATEDALGLLVKPFQSKTLLFAVRHSLDYAATGVRPEESDAGLTWF